MAAVTDKAIVPVVERFFQRPEIRGNLEFLSSRLPPSAEIFVAGGSIRNLIINLLHGHAPPTRDIDIFIGGLDREFSLSGVLSDQTAEPTDLKGMRWYPVSSALAYDLCLLVDFVVIDVGHLAPTMGNLLSGIDFTVNAVIYDFHRKMLFENGCTAAVRDRVIDFNSRFIPDKQLIAYRILLMGYKTGFNLSQPVFQYLKTRLDVATVIQLKGLFRAKVGKTMTTAIMSEYNKWCKYPTYNAYLADRKRLLQAGRPAASG
ncbi:hypothetical protein [uncultured Desulfosarcina sp.]|uniref:hypothetical protein n=1 Tax=uncultured Desulfosarcina sp. TaxID=218289 RepID=UPI0029C6285D|nr:hypothetical protein [uncultured Desulfosarcina sp.]